jgi:1-acyl-sn-glycerol-3-phosphate acyltransferase
MLGDRSPLPGTRPHLLVFRMLNAFARLILRLLLTRIVVEGRERVPDRPGVILASNHLSILDPVLLTLVVDNVARRRVRYMAKAEALAWPFFGLLLRRYGGFAVRRGTPDREAYRTARNVLAEGDWLGLAPEGTRSRTGTMGEAKPGVALLAMRSGAPVLPVGIWGTEKLWGIGSRRPHFRATVTIRIGDVYEPGAAGGRATEDPPGGGERLPDHAAASDGGRAPAATDEAAVPVRAETRARRRESVDGATEDLMERIALLLPEQYRGRFGRGDGDAARPVNRVD